MAGKPIEETNTRIVGAGGEDLGSLGTVRAVVTVGDQSVEIPFYLAEGIKANIILGNNVMKKMNLILDFEEEKIKTPSGMSIPIDIYKPREEREIEVLAKRQIIIPPRTVCLTEVMMFQLEKENVNKPIEVYTPLRLFSHTKVYIPSGIVQGQKNIVELVNIFPYEVKIYKNQVIGVASITVSQPVNIVDARKIDLKENLQSAEERGVENKTKLKN